MSSSAGKHRKTGFKPKRFVMDGPGMNKKLAEVLKRIAPMPEKKKTNAQNSNG
jgi:hypothetical protein